MTEISPNNQQFLNLLNACMQKELSNSAYGVSELADDMHMSRSNLLRKIKSITDLSASQYIRKYRLEKAVELLQEGESNVSEIAYAVGFSSSAYFIKCFREAYAYPPGEFKRRDFNKPTEKKVDKKRPWLKFAIVALVLALVLIFWWMKSEERSKKNLEKSIAVLPFINDSNDSSNVYVVNGLMENILNNLQQIEGLKVLSRTSVEKYRGSNKTIPEIAKELKVNYVLEGSGQKIGEKIRLNVQLINAGTDYHMWSKAYERNTNDVFALQAEVSEKIAQEIHVALSPDVKQRIEQVPTENMKAYDYFLKGVDQLNLETMDGLIAGIDYLQMAIAEDEEFARAYAALAMAYYYLDMFQAQRDYVEKVNHYADKALLYDPHLPQGLTAKALYYMGKFDYSQAITYLEKALEYNPNSAMVINTLSDIYATKMPDTGKYLEYALKGVSLDIAANDSSTASYIYLHLSNALIQSGFVSESRKAIERSLTYNPNNLFSAYVRAYIIYAQNKNLEETERLVFDAYQKDTTRLDLLQELGNVCYYLRDYESAYLHFKKYMDIKESLALDIYIHKNMEIGYVYEKMGHVEEAKKLFDLYKTYALADASIYQPMSLAMYYAHMGEEKRALEEFERFATLDDFQYWILLFIEQDPLLDNISQHPRFKKAIVQMEKGFWKNHKKLRKQLDRESLLDEL